MDQWMRSFDNMIRGMMRISGDMYQVWGSTMGLNPFMQPWADSWNKLGGFLKEKGNPIESRSWMTPSRVVQSRLKVDLRKFNLDNRGNPLLLVPPEAGHNSQIVDFGPGQSLVQCALENFEGDVFVADKLPAGPEHTEYSIDDCIKSLDLCIRKIGRPVHLVGLCQGGWQAAIYSALFPERVKTLTLAGAPIDFHAGDGLISHMAQKIPLSFYQSLVALGGGCMPGAFIVGGFKLMNAYDRFVGDDLSLYRNIEDPDSLERFQRFSQWYEWTQPLPGRMYLDVVDQLFKRNRLVRGKLEIMGRSVDLSRIYHPIFLLGGSRDHITPPAQLMALKDHVSSKAIETKVVDAGHIGVFMRKDLIKGLWTDLFTRLSEPRCRTAKCRQKTNECLRVLGALTKSVEKNERVAGSNLIFECFGGRLLISGTVAGESERRWLQQKISTSVDAKKSKVSYSLGLMN